MELREDSALILPKGYKNTEVGVIPEDWEVKEFGEICYPSKSRMNPITSDSNYKCIELEHLSQASGFLLGYANSKDLKSQKSFFEEGDVLFGKLRPYLKKFYFADFKGVCTTEIWVLKSERETSNRFLFHLVQSDKIVEAANLSTGTKMPRAEWKTVSETKIPVPTKAEQTAIATALSDADALINSLEKLIAKKRNIKQGAMQQLLKPKEGWEVKKLGDLITYKNGKSFESFIDENGEYYLITLNSLDIKGEFKKEHLRVKEFDNSLEKGDLIMVLSDVAHGNFLGLTDVIPENNKYVLNQRMGALKNLKGVTSRFLSIYINHYQSYFKLSGKGSSQQNLGKDDILKFKIHLPTSEEQIRIATIFSDMDAEIQALETKLEKYRNVKLGMMQNLLTGKIRLV